MPDQDYWVLMKWTVDPGIAASDHSVGGRQPVLAALFTHGFYFWSDWGQAFDWSSVNGNGFSVWLVALPSFLLPDCKLCAGSDSAICTEPRLQCCSATTSEVKWNQGCSGTAQSLREIQWFKFTVPEACSASLFIKLKNVESNPILLQLNCHREFCSVYIF